MGKDKVVGVVLIGMSTVIFVYYTAWVGILPFVPDGNVLHAFFPPQMYAVAIPATLLSVGVTVIILVASLLILREKAAIKQKHM